MVEWSFTEEPKGVASQLNMVLTRDLKDTIKDRIALDPASLIFHAIEIEKEKAR